jgi:hypothetical protein
MNTFFFSKKRIFTSRRKFLWFLPLLVCLFSTIFFTACKKETDYFSYVSETCDNILLAKNDVLSVRVYAINRENPYLADGIPREKSRRAEFFIVASSGDSDCILSFSANGKTWGGDASYDGVKAQYYYSCSVDLSNCKTLLCTVQYGGEEYTLEIKSVKTENTLTPKKVLQSLQKTRPEILSALTDDYGFAGEIYVRLLYEENLYYYVGVTDRNGKTHAFLFNAQTGKLLAERKP